MIQTISGKRQIFGKQNTIQTVKRMESIRGGSLPVRVALLGRYYITPRSAIFFAVPDAAFRSFKDAGPSQFTVHAKTIVLFSFSG